MNKIIILLVEDDYLSRRLINKLLVAQDFQVIECKNSKEALQSLDNTKVDLAILDINLGNDERGDGIDLAITLQSIHGIPIIFLTAHDTSDIIKRAVNALPQAYLTKPVRDIDLITSIELALKKTNNAKTPVPYITLKENDFLIKIPIEKIDYIVSERNYLKIHTEDKVYRYRSTIKQILEILPSQLFRQIHRAYIINKDKIDMLGRKSILIKNETVPISKHYVEDIERLYEFPSN